MQGYGYQFWRGRHNSYRGDGANGQYCLVLPDQDAVIATTSGVPNPNLQTVLDQVQSQHWDLVILDVTMPGPSGIDVLRDLKRLAGNLVERLGIDRYWSRNTVLSWPVFISGTST